MKTVDRQHGYTCDNLTARVRVRVRACVRACVPGSSYASVVIDSGWSHRGTQRHANHRCAAVHKPGGGELRSARQCNVKCATCSDGVRAPTGGGDDSARRGWHRTPGPGCHADNTTLTPALRCYHTNLRRECRPPASPQTATRPGLGRPAAAGAADPIDDHWRTNKNRSARTFQSAMVFVPKSTHKDDAVWHVRSLSARVTRTTTPGGNCFIYYRPRLCFQFYSRLMRRR